jgi:integrase/recombinase XerD
MKSLALSNASFRYLEQSFKEWLDILGYAPSTVYYAPLHVRELLHYLENKGIKEIKQLDSKHNSLRQDFGSLVKAHYERLKERSNARRDGGLSNNHLNKHIQAIRKFADYLRQVGRLELAAVPLKNEEANTEKIIVLTQEEIQQLFEATSKPPQFKYKLSPQRIEAIQGRDRAMLAVYYGCGLRRNEGVKLNVSDVYFDKRLLHVKKGKNYKERFVPISKSSLKHFQEYVYDHRPELLQGANTDAFFLNQSAQRLGGQSLLLRLKYLQQQTENEELKEKEIGLHTLRHSIATHLLQGNMKLENISRFLGHSSLESTQIYTHLAGVDQQREQSFSNIRHYEKVQLHEDELQ